MRTPVLAVAAATALVTVALPSLAEETTPTEPVPTQACENPDDLLVIGKERFETTAAAPVVPNMVFHDANSTGGLPVESPAESILEIPILVDASGGDGSANQPVDATRAVIGIAVDWAEPNGDYDVYLVNDKGAELGSGTSFNPLDGPGETITGPTVNHCSVVTLRIENYAGIPGAELAVSGFRTRLR